MENKENFLTEKYPDLPGSEDVEKAVQKNIRRGEKGPATKEERVEVYLDRLEKVFLNPDKDKRERNIEMLRDKIYDKLLIKPEHVPDSYFELQKRVARERGQDVKEIPEDVRSQMIETIIADQKHSLGQWIDYLSSDDAAYPAWFKYFVWRNVIKLSQFDKTLGKFKKRTESTTAPYPDIYRAPLAKILDIYEKAAENKGHQDPKLQEDFSKRFPALYAELISESLAVTVENREQVKGKWLKYEKNDEHDADQLFNSVQAKGTGWCIEGQTTARNYIKAGDFYVYYTEDKLGKPVQPRLAIQMDGQQIGQIRGVLEHQNVEPIMQDVLDEKLKEFGQEADAYRKKSRDMAQMTELEAKMQKSQEFTNDELMFLYEMDNTIEGFGYEKDPRINELREKRNPEEDMLIIFECKKEQIATKPQEITKNTKAYVGKLEPGIFELAQIYNIEHIYTSFPEGRVRMQKLEIGGKPRGELEKELKEKRIKTSDHATDMLHSKDFTTLENQENIKLVRLKVSDLGFKNGATTEEIYKKAEELGLELCPAEVGPQLRLKYTDQPMGEWLFIGMKQIPDRDGNPHVFDLVRNEYGLWLYDSWATPDRRWFPADVFVFSCKFKTLKP